MKQHVLDLLRKHNIQYHANDYKEGKAWFCLGRPTVEIPRMDDDISYFIALHEIGHFVGPRQENWCRILESELGAWEWAIYNAEYLTDEMVEFAREALGTYLKGRAKSTQEKYEHLLDKALKNCLSLIVA